MNFLDLTDRHNGFDRAKIVILPISYGGHGSLSTALAKAPQSIITASRRLETYDLDTGCEVSSLGIHTHAPLELAPDQSDQVAGQVRKAAERIFKAGKFPLALGGRQLISLGMIEAALNRYPSLSVIHLDARLDQLDPVTPELVDDGSVMQQVSGLCPVIHLGTRCVSRTEVKKIDRDRMVTSRDIAINGVTAAMDALDLLGDAVYISIDLDVLDPGIMPAVACPEPGGLDWFTLLSLLRRIISEKTVVAFDVVELLPGQDRGPDYVAAKLVYQLLSRLFQDAF
jgi:agmatinase